jgi:hypothetical protein
MYSFAVSWTRVSRHLWVLHFSFFFLFQHWPVNRQTVGKQFPYLFSQCQVHLQTDQKILHFYLANIHFLLHPIDLWSVPLLRL